MSENKYKNILTGYVNERQDKKGHYLVITNVGDSEFVLPKGEKVYLNKTPKDVLDKYPKVPHYSKSEKIVEKVVEEIEEEQINNGNTEDDIPF